MFTYKNLLPVVPARIICPNGSADLALVLCDGGKYQITQFLKGV